MTAAHGALESVKRAPKKRLKREVGNGFIDMTGAGSEERTPLLFIIAVIALVFIVIICRGAG